jgi:hypothetical protein
VVTVIGFTNPPLVILGGIFSYKGLNMQEVSLGASLIDSNHLGDRSWRKKCIGMDIQSPNDCVLFRVYGGYTKGLDVLKINGDNDLDRQHGFDILTFGGDIDEDYAKLQAAWDEELKSI